MIEHPLRIRNCETETFQQKWNRRFKYDNLEVLEIKNTVIETEAHVAHN